VERKGFRLFKEEGENLQVVLRPLVGLDTKKKRGRGVELGKKTPLNAAKHCSEARECRLKKKEGKAWTHAENTESRGDLGWINSFKK